MNHNPVKSGIEWLGELTLFTRRTFKSSGRILKRFDIFLNQCEFIGVSSLGVLSVAAVFIGSSLGYQLYKSFELFGAQALVAGHHDRADHRSHLTKDAHSHRTAH